MEHNWKFCIEFDVGLQYSINKCDRCGVRLPAHLGTENINFDFFNIYKDCDLQIAKSVMTE